MSKVASSSPTLRRIQASGVLRVGTTGDYTPFSLLQPDGSYIGADIDMAHDLAERLGVDIEFVPSVWIDLLDHFLADGSTSRWAASPSRRLALRRPFFRCQPLSTASGRWRAASIATASPTL